MMMNYEKKCKKTSLDDLLFFIKSNELDIPVFVLLKSIYPVRRLLLLGISVLQPLGSLFTDDSKIFSNLEDTVKNEEKYNDFLKKLKER